MKKLIAAGAIALVTTSLTASAMAEDLDAFNARATKITEDATKTQTATPPNSGPAIAKNKTIVIIPCSMGAEGCARVARSTQEAATVVGWKSVLIDGGGDLSTIANAIRKAISIHADGISIMAVDAKQVQGALKEARAAGIKIVSAASANQDGLYDTVNPSQDASVEAGYAIAAQAYQQNGRKLWALEMNDREFAIVQWWLSGVEKFMKECAEAGGDCKMLGTDNFLVGDLTTRLPDQTVALVRNHPDYNYLFAGYDAALNFMIKGLHAAGLDKQGHSAGFDGNLANLDFIRKDGYQDASLANAMEWYGYEHVDQLNRLFNNQPVVPTAIRFKVINKGNAPEKGGWVGDVDFKSFYRQAWGVK
ncbi:substrate-binding domain-containing protein [Mesorhizobium cantuariense]|uniref:Substrate-binding domain-containing protein n=1 Tax=Mesorhizobium cantuariense TaxID=1300275 RepID=A0ABV7MP72_9HYPH